MNHFFLIFFLVITTYSYAQISNDDFSKKILKITRNDGASGTAFFISPHGYFLATQHGFEKCLSENVGKKGYYPNFEKVCQGYTALYNQKNYDIQIIAHLDFKSTGGGTIADKMLSNDFILGQIHLDNDETVPYFNLKLKHTSLYQYININQGTRPFYTGDNSQSILLELFFSPLKAPYIFVAGYPDGQYRDFKTFFFARESNNFIIKKGYLVYLDQKMPCASGSSGSPVFDKNTGALYGMIVSKSDTDAVALSIENIIEKLSSIDNKIKQLLFNE